VPAVEALTHAIGDRRRAAVRSVVREIMASSAAALADSVNAATWRGASNAYDANSPARPKVASPPTRRCAIRSSNSTACARKP
jgi:hypothetical protein